MRNITSLRKELAVLAVLVGSFVPVYLLKLFDWPHQINSDEIAIMSAAKEWGAQPWGRIFEISHYFDFPAMVFMIYGKLANLVGGVGLYNSRFIHACVGLAIIAASYVLFRQLLNRRTAVIATIILGANHSLLMISRMAMRDNSGLLIEVVALAILVYGWQRKNWQAQLAGGMVAGLGWYVYYPARLVIVIWLGFLMVHWILERKFMSLICALVPVLAGFGLIVLPLFYNLVIAPSPRFHLPSRFLWTAEGRNHQQKWLSAGTETEGLVINIKNGLTTFNNKVSDRGYIYPNEGHGFVDPLTGLLLWQGVIVILLALQNHKPSKQSVLMGGGFLGILLIFSFIINIAPNYTRLLVSLPFVAYLAAIGVVKIEGWVSKQIKNRLPLISAMFVMVIVAWNLTIANDFIRAGTVMGDDLGSTARYMLSKQSQANYHFYVVADDYIRYYDWGDKDIWMFWTSFFALPSQEVVVVGSDFQQTLPRNTTVFASGVWWEANKASFSAGNQNGLMTVISKKPYLVAIDLQ